MTFEGREVNELHKDDNIRIINHDAFGKRYGFDPATGYGEGSNVIMGRAKDGEAVLFVKTEGISSYLRLNSEYSPAYEAERWSYRLSKEMRRTVYLVLGFSTGVYVRALLGRCRPDTEFYIYEPDEALFSFVCEHTDITDLISHPRINIYLSKNRLKQMTNEILHDLAGYKSETRIVTTPYYSENIEFNGICHEVESAMASKQLFQAGRSRIALKCRAYAWTQMNNAYVITELRRYFPEDVPAVIVAAGPSLNKNVEYLKKIKGHAFIICADRALKILDKYGIVPDVIITMDAEKSTDYLNASVARDSYLLCSYQTNIETQKLFAGRCIYYHALQAEKELIGDKVGETVFDHGGNVAGAAFVICKELGIREIVLVGQDLAYLDGKHHADEKEDGNPNVVKKYVKGINGENVETNEMWIAFRDFFERQIALNPEMDVIDATEGGALIKGTKIMSLKDAADRLQDRAVSFSKVFSKMEYAQNIDEHEKTISTISQWIDDLKVITEKSKELEEICRKLINACKYSDINESKYANKKKRLGELKYELHRMKIYTIIENQWIEDIYSIPDLVLFLRNNEEALPILENAEKYYSSLPKECEELRQELMKVIDHHIIERK